MLKSVENVIILICQKKLMQLSILDPCVTRASWDNMGLRLWRHIHSSSVNLGPKHLLQRFLLDLHNNGLAFIKLVSIRLDKSFSRFIIFFLAIWYEKHNFLSQIQFKIFYFATRCFLLSIQNLAFLILPASNAKNNHLASSREFPEMWLKFGLIFGFCVTSLYYIMYSCVRC